MQNMESPGELTEKHTVAGARKSQYVLCTKRRIMLLKSLGYVFGMPYSFALGFIFRFVMNYRIPNMRQIRSQFREIIKSKEPIVICCNHLTFIDSGIIIWALASNFWYLFHYNYFSWNLPAGDFFGKKFHYRLIANIVKGIFIYRDGPKEHHDDVLNAVKNLVKSGEIVTIFPEGKRSRVGYFDPEKMTYGVAKILKDVPDCRVLCMYVRSNKQKQFSNYPPRNSVFHVSMKVIKPTTSLEGREGSAHLMRQVAQEIKSQENEYFISENKRKSELIP